MQAPPRRLGRSAARPAALRAEAGPLAWPDAPDHTPLVRRVRAVRRLVGALLWTLLAIPVQSVCILLPGRPKVIFARLYWRGMSWLLGLRVRLIGHRPATGDRPVVFVSNHSSWLDIPVLGGRVETCFISKEDVARWPLVSLIARLGRTVFVSRQRTATARERDVMVQKLAAGDNLMLFPEGTTSDGSRVLPFRSAFFAVVEGPTRPLVQPVSVVYDRLDGLPTGRATRPLFAWYGDMDIASHFWRLAQHRGLRATILLHPPLDPAEFPDRKTLARKLWAAVADGAATLRQNRPPPTPTPAPTPSPSPSPSPLTGTRSVLAE